ncbi:hypothetical protein LX32DRAFT_201911 [Colletotrichum zoysiae]|uniref:Uncharacterized protein n=1 Tax=Colletotrichum zoysiae TaxID=1216348 RepID=A0AAD9H4R6_9PEZI|nr:hypothetical protein LX32DRAFT_201911 [Colletotrichum zoysiae]
MPMAWRGLAVGPGAFGRYRAAAVSPTPRPPSGGGWHLSHLTPPTYLPTYLPAYQVAAESEPEPRYRWKPLPSVCMPTYSVCHVTG